MNQAAAISAVYRAVAHYRRRQANSPTDHSAREIAQMSMLAEYLHESQSPSRVDYESGRTKDECLLAWEIPQTAFASSQLRQLDPPICAR